MRVFLYLSGEHSTLPMAEALATFDALKISYEVLGHFEQVLALEIEDLDDIHTRIAMAHSICELFGICEADYEKIKNLSKDVEAQGTFAVRVKRVQEYNEEVSTAELEKIIGGLVKDQGYSVDLKNPSDTIFGILSEKFALGRIIKEVDRSQYEARRPHTRPYFKPGTMLPRNCRAIVNLTRVNKGDTFVDPFCGTGGFLIEAGLLGCKTFGYDFDPKALVGCEKNLKQFGLADYHLERMDARELGKTHPENFDALAADLPYGISSSVFGQNLDDLCSESLESFYAALKKDSYACVVSPNEVEVPDLAKEVGFAFIEEHFERIHRSLTRRITVLKKT